VNVILTGAGFYAFVRFFVSDSESFAEIKRLKQIMDELEGNAAFVLLDEILRGTNSDDKRNGTIEVVKKVIANKAWGYRHA
jgi:DNA mismatch repair ATPase MutS